MARRWRSTALGIRTPRLRVGLTADAPTALASRSRKFGQTPRGKEILAGNVSSAIRYWLRVLNGWGKFPEETPAGAAVGVVMQRIWDSGQFAF